MHQRQSLRPSIRRFVLPVSVASTLAAVFVAVTSVAGACYPLCVLWTSDNPEWWLFFCALC